MLDAELEVLIAQYPAFDPAMVDLAEMRAARAALLPKVTGTRDGVEISELHIDTPSEPIRLLIYRPVGAEVPLPAMLHIHGGGYILGAPEISDSDNLSRAGTARCVVVSVDYPLAPEAPYPAAIEACYSALCWLWEEAGALGVDRTRIAVGGESAGGGLAAALALLARERGCVAPTFQFLIYPMIDDRTMPTHNRQFPIWTPQANRFGWNALLDGKAGTDDVPMFAAAARAQDLFGLPPAFIAVGSLDLFLRENVNYAMRLLAAGIPVDLHVLAGGCHGFDSLGDTAIGRRFKALCVESLARIFWPNG